MISITKYFLEIIKISSPYMVSTFFDATSFTLMVFIVSFFLPSGKELASLGSSIYIVWVLWGISTAFSSGVISLTSRFLGDKNIKNIVHLFAVCVYFTFLWYIFIVIIFNLFLVDFIFSFLKLDSDIVDLAKEVVVYYSYIIIFSIFASIVFSVLQGLMKTKEIMYITILAVFVEVLIVFLGVKYWGLKLSLLINIAWLAGELIRISFGYYFLKQSGIYLNFSISKELNKSLSDDFTRFLETLYIGFPLKIGSLIFGSVYYFIISIITDIGQRVNLAEKAVAALTLSQRFEVFIWMLDAGLTVATTTIIGKTIGYETFQQNKQKKINEINNIITASFIIGTLFFLPIFVIFIFFNQELLYIFIKDKDIVNIGKGYLFWTGVMGLSMVYNAILTGFFIAIGKTLPLTLYLIIFSILRIPLSSLANSFDGVWIVINLTNVFMTISLIITYLFAVRRL
ncbi:MAG: MATE family efflux transporter [Candidatus Calescibacterium sp.]|nr:MATE family efflux transporter [Candidatus Calescibacterium sp.]MCX7972199.1 MATE family efflux transporter [bacterium]MDW8194889.1 MATE family efflux transporter [Candidatus Calescibacterium sp.]